MKYVYSEIVIFCEALIFVVQVNHEYSRQQK